MRRALLHAALLLLLTGCGTTEDLVGVIVPGAGASAGATGNAGAPPAAGAPAFGGGAGGGALAGAGGSTGSGTSGSGGEPSHPDVVAGFRAARYGIDPFPAPAYWGDAATAYAAALGATAGGVWIVGTVRYSTDCVLTFPSPGSSPPHVTFGDTDENESYLTHFDALGLRVWLMVEPADADVETLIDLALDRYGSHPSVAGFAVAVEWYRESQQTHGIAVPDAAAASWRDRVQAHDPSYTLALQHWLIDRMPPGERSGLVFLNDSQILPDSDALVDEFAVWGQAFDPSPVAFVIGYESDRDWWSDLRDPPTDLGYAIIARIPNTAGVFWLDATIREVL